MGSGVCLSVDWDFFIPDALSIWDSCVIDETLYHLWENWKKPNIINLHDKIKTKNVKDFWKWLSQWFVLTPGRQAIVSESHSYIYKMLTENQKTLILFDSHHDCYPLDDWEYKNDIIDCGNWGTAWLSKNIKNNIAWVCQHNNEYILDDFFDNIDHYVENRVSWHSLNTIENYFEKMFKRNGGKIKLDFIHICRSGCWSPPWTDVEFLNFTKDSNFSINAIQKFIPQQYSPFNPKVNYNAWDPLIDRLNNKYNKTIYKVYKRQLSSKSKEYNVEY